MMYRESHPLPNPPEFVRCFRRGSTGSLSRARTPNTHSWTRLSILMYAHDTSAGAKYGRAKALVEELWRDRMGVVSTQVLQELAVNLRKKARKPLDAKATREIKAVEHQKHVHRGGCHILYTLCETARLVSVDPQAYLLRAVCVAIARPAVTWLDDLSISTRTN